MKLAVNIWNLLNATQKTRTAEITHPRTFDWNITRLHDRSNQTEPDSEPKQKISVQVAKLDFSSVDSSPCESPRENKKSAQRDSEVSEITYSFTVDSVPPGFQETEEAKGQQNDVKGQEEEEEEEYSETITEVIYPLSSSSDGPGSPRRIPDLDSPKEHVKPLVENPKETVKAQPQVPSQETATKQAEVEKSKEVKQEKEKPKEVKHEKEEFVLTFDDLQNVDFTGPKKKKPQSLNLKTDTKPPGEEVKRRSGRKSPAVVTSPVLVLEELRSIIFKLFKTSKFYGDQNMSQELTSLHVPNNYRKMHSVFQMRVFHIISLFYV